MSLSSHHIPKRSKFILQMDILEDFWCVLYFKKVDCIAYPLLEDTILEIFKFGRNIRHIPKKQISVLGAFHWSRHSKNRLLNPPSNPPTQPHTHTLFRTTPLGYVKTGAANFGFSKKRGVAVVFYSVCFFYQRQFFTLFFRLSFCFLESF